MTLLEAMRHQRTLHIEAAERIGDAILAIAAVADAPGAEIQTVAQTTIADEPAAAPDTGQLFTIDGHRDDG